MRSLLLLIAGLSIASPALAGQPVTLKADTFDTDGVVTLGDLFDGAGAMGKTPVAARPNGGIVLDALAVQTVARRAGLDWANVEGVRKIVVRGAGYAPGAASGSAASASRTNVDVLTYARNLAAGEILQPADLIWGKAAASPADAPADPDQVIGLAAKRALRAGASVSARDVGAAQVIKLGEIITVLYEAEGISLALQGKALASAGVGETLAVQNTASKRTIQTMVTGPGQAVVGPAAESLKISRTIRYAAR